MLSYAILVPVSNLEMPSSAYSESESEPDADTFGTLLSIPQQSLVLLATNIRERTFAARTSKACVRRTLSGSYNLIHVIELDDFQLIIRIPETGWGRGLTDTAGQALISHVHTLKLIKSHTTIPVPEVYAFDTSVKNEIGAPYIAMSYISGYAASPL